MEYTNMKKTYIKPQVLTVELKMYTTLLIGSKDYEGMETEIIDTEEVEIGF